MIKTVIIEDEPRNKALLEELIKINCGELVEVNWRAVGACPVLVGWRFCLSMPMQLQWLRRGIQDGTGKSIAFICKQTCFAICANDAKNFGGFLVHLKRA